MLCSLTINASQMALIAATLAAGGTNPITEERIFETSTVRNCLSLMSSSGMYDYSGEFAFTMGFPSKSGVAGALMLVIPGTMVWRTIARDGWWRWRPILMVVTGHLHVFTAPRFAWQFGARYRVL
jgi:glutaminase